ncbi:hypothetical protein [Desulfovibrio inopinatus]|uniref:hypothetical protein n=1 Tax=Desulfovibrio inopinatus TaxID=102109 RepID=UPI00040B76A6|nr:hypothetical protein [Desulfovibrio inopinatus]
MAYVELLGPLLLIGLCIYVYIKLRRFLKPLQPSVSEHHSPSIADTIIFYTFLTIGLLVTAGGIGLFAYQSYMMTTQGVIVELKLYTLFPEKLTNFSTSPVLTTLIDTALNIPVSIVCIALGVSLVYLTWLSRRKTNDS